MRRLMRVVMVIFALFATAVVANKVRFRYNWQDAFWRTLLTPFVFTIWAEGFSEESFAKVQLGIQEREVEALVGKPVRKDCDGKGCLWDYAEQDSDNAPYDRRWISFDTKSRVVRIRHEFYID